MRREIENSLVGTYGRLTLLSATIMLLGWLWHLWQRDARNGIITVGIGLLLLTPLLTLAHLAYLTMRTDPLVARYSLIVLVLVGLAVLVGLWTGGAR